ncbi:MAG TPA: rhodanese-like domain-containing protein [Gallionellaceae bacterium]|nr:rhodanese-like domain-containing protein [Gallionellaceae bacterium]
MQFIQSNIWLALIAVTSGLMLLWSFFGNRLRGVKEVNCVAALQLINHKEACILDVREQDEFKAGHLLNAKSIPLGKLRDRIGELERYREKPIVVVCRSGQRSATACALLDKEGFSQVYNLSGGVTAWQKSSLPLEK